MSCYIVSPYKQLPEADSLSLPSISAQSCLILEGKCTLVPVASGEWTCGVCVRLILKNIQSWLHLHAGHFSYLLHMAGVFPHFVKLIKPREGSGLHNVDACVFGDMQGHVALTWANSPWLSVYHFCILAPDPGSDGQHIWHIAVWETGEIAVVSQMTLEKLIEFVHSVGYTHMTY
jgi:hypothetical protein